MCIYIYIYIYRYTYICIYTRIVIIHIHIHIHTYAYLQQAYNRVASQAIFYSLSKSRFTRAEAMSEGKRAGCCVFQELAEQKTPA